MKPLCSLNIFRRPAACALALAAGCAVGPDFHKPPPPSAEAYSPRPLSAASATNLAGGEAQRFVAGLDIPAEWWTVFHCRPLDDLIERSLARNPDLKAGQAALAAAREIVLAQRGAYLPAVDGGLSASRQKTSDAISPTPSSGELNFTLYTPQLSVSYVPDVFGLNRRMVEAATARAEQARFALAASHITLSSNIAAAAVQEASLRAQIAATRELIRVGTDTLRVLRNQYEKGYASRLDVAAQESQLAALSATLPPLEKQLDEQRHLLTALSGALPDRELPESFELSALELPRELPLSLPSRLVEQRPDVRQAEENLHAASAQIGIAVANRLPNITLTASAGSMALSAGQIFGSGTAVRDLGVAVTQPIYRGGALLHQERAARAAYEQAAEQYRSTVLTAFQSVADTLSALQHDADTLNAAAAAEQAAGVTLELTKKQWQSGYAGYLALLNAEQAHQQALLNRVQAQASRYADTVALFQALGGGWWHERSLGPL
ncbi:MAG TPA: efflux transporter outer membrane subunit [Steroidobacteraceae bacterium]|nr:efflux transporter outer membrane subunit [Steroidobacteraceae bacterium]